MYRTSALIIGLCIFAVGCSNSPSSPSAPPQGSTSTTTFTVPLAPANEVPAVTNGDASASGTAVIAFAVTKDGSGTITAATANIQMSVAGFPAGTTVTGAHIHNGPVGSNAGVYVSSGLGSGELTLVNGSGSLTKSGINVPADQAAAILANPAGHYFNIHTALNPGGAIRGQLSAGSAAVEPGVSSPY